MGWDHCRIGGVVCVGGPAGKQKREAAAEKVCPERSFMNYADNPAVMILKAIWEAGTKDEHDRLYLAYDAFTMAESLIESFYPGLLRDPNDQQEDNGWQE
jgi:hypothetical protein